MGTRKIHLLNLRLIPHQTKNSFLLRSTQYPTSKAHNLLSRNGFFHFDLYVQVLRFFSIIHGANCPYTIVMGGNVHKQEKYYKFTNTSIPQKVEHILLIIIFSIDYSKFGDLYRSMIDALDTNVTERLHDASLLRSNVARDVEALKS